ncbi:MAG: hypothetical protein K0R39_1538 [Symbiobacteriaceae bacterium]|jgi:hypothetical protein|nr:hypothetical protein [Symbiobacteriaceae bacterium]
MGGRDLKGARQVSVTPERLQLPKYGDKPGWRGEKPGTIWGNTGAGVQVKEASKSRLGSPDPTWAHVTFRFPTPNETLLVVAPVHPPVDPLKPEPNTYRIGWSDGAPIIRGLKLLAEAAQIVFRPDVWYEMSTELGEDEGGAVVWSSWTEAVLSPRTASAKDEGETGDSEVAAGNQP